MIKPILCLDFDGVAHSYTSGWRGASIIPDPPVPGLCKFLDEAVKHFDVRIFSSRSNQEGGLEAMEIWFSTVLEEKGFENVFPQLGFPEEKPPAMVSIDDRAITFSGIWPDIETLKNFKPWNKKGE